jgi:hypothetical protein
MGGYIFNPKKAIHFSVGGKIGLGSVFLNEGFDISDDFSDENLSDYYTDMIGVISPQVNVDFNFTPWLTVNIGAGYRYVFGISDKLYDASDDGLNNPDKRFFEDNAFNSPYGNIKFAFILSGFFSKKNKK